MSGKLFGRHLKYKVIGYCICSLLAAAALFVILSYCGLRIVERWVYSDEYQIRLEKKVVGEMEQFIRKENIGPEDTQQIHDWMEKQWGLYIEVYRNYDIWMDTWDEGYFEAGEGKTVLDPEERYYTLSLGDQEIQVLVYDVYYSQKYAWLAELGCIVLSFVLFVALYTKLVQKRFAYIDRLEDSMNTMEGGDLERPVPVIGKDELASLANSMDRMRLAFAKQLQEKNRVKEAREELIRAVSHDLRSPLSTQIAYLDLASQEEEPERIREYLDVCRNKAGQMTNLLNQIFHYYQDYEATREDVVLEEVSGNDLLIQLTEEQACLLREREISLEIVYIEEPFVMRINPEYMCRIYDNLFSNVDKYADPEAPLRILYSLEEEKVVLKFSNEIRREAAEEAGSRIGLKNIRRMASLQGGGCEIRKEENHFEAKLWFPAERK